MEIRQLETFVRVVQMQSFTKAAESLGYSQAAVTVQIQLLEQELGVRLFDRIKKRVTLTSQGRTLLGHAGTILREVHEASAAVTDETELRGALHIGVISSLCYASLPPILKRMRTLHPKVSVHITTAPPEELLRLMERNEVDLVYLLDDARYSNNWYKAMEKREEVVLVASPALGLDPARPLDLDTLVTLPFFLTEPDENYRRTFDRFLAAKQKAVQPVIESSNTEFLIRMLEYSAGVSVLPLYTVRRSVAAKRLQILPVRGLDIVMYRQIFMHKSKWRTREMAEFIRLAHADPN